MCINLDIIYVTVINTISALTCLVLCAVNLSGLGRKLLDIFTVPRLLTLGLGDLLDMSYEQIDIVSDFLHEAKYIQELRLKNLHCLSHSKVNANCKIIFDVSRNNALRELYVVGQADKFIVDTSNMILLESRFLEVPGVTKALLLECLKGSQIQSENDFTFDLPVDKTAMIEIVSDFEAVKHVQLHHMDFTNAPLRFPKRIKQLECVMLNGIKIDNASLRHMLDDLPTQRVEIWMGKRTISYNGDEEFVKDYIRRSDKFEVTLDDPIWTYFHTVC